MICTKSQKVPSKGRIWCSILENMREIRHCQDGHHPGVIRKSNLEPSRRFECANRKTLWWIFMEISSSANPSPIFSPSDGSQGSVGARQQGFPCKSPMFFSLEAKLKVIISSATVLITSIPCQNQKKRETLWQANPLQPRNWTTEVFHDGTQPVWLPQAVWKDDNVKCQKPNIWHIMEYMHIHIIYIHVEYNHVCIHIIDGWQLLNCSMLSQPKWTRVWILINTAKSSASKRSTDMKVDSVTLWDVGI